VSGEHALWPTEVYMPVVTGQVAQELDPAAAENVPALQLVHDEAPLSAENLPATHEMHWVPPVVSL